MLRTMNFHYKSTKKPVFVLLNEGSLLSLNDFVCADMNTFKYSLLVLLLTFSLPLWAGEDEKVKFIYDVDFEMRFDNREFYRSDFSRSMTVFGARLTPSVGLYLPQNEVGMEHRLMLGIDVMKDFGASPVSKLLGGDLTETSPRLNNAALFRELTLYYHLNRQTERTGLELYAGIFPRRASEGEYSDVFFSDSLKYYDNNLEGILLKIRRPKAYWEVGCDWMGQYGQVRKEKFMIFSSGRSRITPFFNVGYSAYMYHFAGSEIARGVVDNILLNPYLTFDFGLMTGFQELSVRLGWLQGMQNDRKFVGHYVFPGGGEIDLGVKKWNVGLRNRLFCGTDMMPYYNSLDAGGDKYGSRLYFGDPFYRMHDDGTAGIGIYDRFEVFYEPHIGKYLTVRIAARFHFHGARYSGCQQIVSLNFNI